MPLSPGPGEQRFRDHQEALDRNLKLLAGADGALFDPRRATVSVHDTDLATMDRDELVSALIQLRAAVRSKHYASDCRHLLPEFRGGEGPKPPWPEFPLDGSE